MATRFHPHARQRMIERGATEIEVVAAVADGERLPARLGRTCFRRNFPFGADWQGRHYATKQIEAYAVQEGGDWLVITVITRFF